MRGRRFGSTLRYHLWSDLRSAAGYYLVLTVVYLALSLMSRRFHGTVGGMELATVLFLLVSGLTTFRERFYLFLQNGFSRKTLVGSFCLSALIFCGCLALADSLLWLLFSLLAPVKSLFQQIYAARDFVPGGFAFIRSLIWSWALYLFEYFLGYVVSCLYFRMGKTAKLAVTIGVPAVVLLGVPALDGVTVTSITAAIGGFFRWALYGANGFCPWCGARSFAIGAAVLALISYLLACRATVRREV